MTVKTKAAVHATIVAVNAAVYYSGMLELIKYYLAIKVSSNAVRNIYEITNLSI